MLRLGLDAMGGDYAPEAAVLGAIKALDRVGDDVRIVMFGDQPAIEAILAREGCAADKFDIVHTTEVIEMGDHPAQAFKSKPNSSIVVGYGYLKAALCGGYGIEVIAGNEGVEIILVEGEGCAVLADLVSADCGNAVSCDGAYVLFIVIFKGEFNV